MSTEQDPGKHYRYTYKGIKLDPARIALIYDIKRPMMFTALKKILCAGNRGAKDKEQDIKDSINALQRELELMQEDVVNVCTYPDCNCPIEKPFNHSPCLKGL